MDVENRFKSFYIWEYANYRNNYQKMLPKTLRILTLMELRKFTNSNSENDVL
jgi:hypothetical protein